MDVDEERLCYNISPSVDQNVLRVAVAMYEGLRVRLGKKTRYGVVDLSVVEPFASGRAGQGFAIPMRIERNRSIDPFRDENTCAAAAARPDRYWLSDGNAESFSLDGDSEFSLSRRSDEDPLHPGSEAGATNHLHEDAATAGVRLPRGPVLAVFDAAIRGGRLLSEPIGVGRRQDRVLPALPNTPVERLVRNSMEAANFNWVVTLENADCFSMKRHELAGSNQMDHFALWPEFAKTM
jgi:hypothetical protein